MPSSADARSVGAGQILLHLFHCAHATEHRRDLGLVPEPLQGPVGRSALHRSAVPDRLDRIGRVDEAAAQQPFHHHDGQSLRRGVAHALGPGLVLDVHVVVLDLAHRPAVVGVDDLLQHLSLVVEGEAQVADAAVGQRAVGPVQHAKVAHLVPSPDAQAVQQVEIDVVGLEPLELLVQQQVEVIRTCDDPAGQLGGQLDLAPGSRPAGRGQGTARCFRRGRGRLCRGS